MASGDTIQSSATESLLIEQQKPIDTNECTHRWMYTLPGNSCTHNLKLKPGSQYDAVPNVASVVSVAHK